MRRLPFLTAVLLALAACAIACDGAKPAPGTPDAPNQGVTPAPNPNTPPAAKFRLITGSENKDLERIFQRFAAEKGVTLDKVKYMGNVDIASEIEAGAPNADAILLSSSLWIAFANKANTLKNTQSVMRSPVVFAVKLSVAQGLGWVGKKVTIKEIMAAAEAGKIRFATTSASQSNTGAQFFVAILSSLAGSPDVLLHGHLNDAKLQAGAQRVLATVGHSSGSSGVLKDEYLKDPDVFDALVNYEAMVIAMNHDLTARGLEPLYAVYPVDGTSIADFPFGYVDHGDAGKAKFFAELQAYILSAPVQTEIQATGRRAGAMALAAAVADPNVFNPAWGIDTARVITPITTPSEAVVREALELYQTVLRKPSFSVFVLDYSASMEELLDGTSTKRVDQMKTAMETVLDPVRSKKFMLQPSARDVNVVIPFCEDVIDVKPATRDVVDVWQLEGNKKEDLRTLMNDVRSTKTCGGTGLYAAMVRAYAEIDRYNAAHKDRRDPKHLSQYFPAVILLTDGEPTDLKATLDAYLAQHPAQRETPIYAIGIGEAKDSVLRQLTREANVFNGNADVGKAIRTAKQYN